jgi:aspartyl-tRNA(Asn)/glutamyl-tRNA(Gln) amidotransferase subunit C
MISIEDTQHVAKLARLELTEEEQENYTKQLGSILSYIEKLNEVDTTGIEPMAHSVKISNVMREDIVVQDFTRDEMLKNAPCEEDGFFKVPKIN